MSLVAALSDAVTTIGRWSVAAGAAPGAAGTPRSVTSLELVPGPRMVAPNVAVWLAPAHSQQFGRFPTTILSLSG
eukprot:COSAG06_NODE_516_length_14818_cov_18.077926_2_plen_75_part_00